MTDVSVPVAEEEQEILLPVGWEVTRRILKLAGKVTLIFGIVIFVCGWLTTLVTNELYDSRVIEFYTVNAVRSAVFNFFEVGWKIMTVGVVLFLLALTVKCFGRLVILTMQQVEDERKDG